MFKFKVDDLVRLSSEAEAPTISKNLVGRVSRVRPPNPKQRERFVQYWVIFENREVGPFGDDHLVPFEDDGLKFKVGDRVKTIIQIKDMTSESVGTIVDSQSYPDKDNAYGVRFNVVGPTYSVYEKHLRHVAKPDPDYDPPKFKMGSLVRLTEQVGAYPARRRGCIQQVIAAPNEGIPANRSHLYRVNFGDGSVLTIKERVLELISEPLFVAGDRVSVKDDLIKALAGTGLEYRSGVIERLVEDTPEPEGRVYMVRFSRFGERRRVEERYLESNPNPPSDGRPMMDVSVKTKKETKVRLAISRSTLLNLVREHFGYESYDVDGRDIYPPELDEVIYVTAEENEHDSEIKMITLEWTETEGGL